MKHHDQLAMVFFRRFLLVAPVFLASSLFAQRFAPATNSFAALPTIANIAQENPGTGETPRVQPGTPAPKDTTDNNAAHKPAPQPKRILGVMPNYRAVSAGAIPPPPSPRQAFKIATQNSFDYSAFVFTGFTSAIAFGQNAHPQLGHGVGGYWAYYWRGFLDKTDGNYMVIFAMPTIFRQDERYYAMGTGPIWKRLLYSSTRVFITPNYHGHNSFNASEIFGRAIAQGISTSYYPSADRTLGALASRWGYAVMRDSFTNMFREFWPDIATHVLHRRP